MPLTPLGSITEHAVARDGTPILMRRWRAPGRPHTFLLLVPDVHEDTSAWEAWARVAQDRGIDIEGFDLRGRGGSAGRLSWGALLDDIEDGLARVRARAGDRQLAIHALGVSATLVLDYALTDRPKPDALSVWTPLRVLPRDAVGDASTRGPLGALRATFSRQPSFSDDFAAAVARVIAGARSIDCPLEVQSSGPALLSKRAIPVKAFRPFTFSSHNQDQDVHRSAADPHSHGSIPSWLETRARERDPGTLPAYAGHTVNELLPRKEARTIFKAHVASGPDRRAAFERSVVEGGGPRPACDRGSLAALGSWMIDALTEGPPSGPEPYWATPWRTWPGPEGRLDTPTLWFIDGLAAHMIHCYGTLWPEFEWKLDTHKSSVSYQEPVFGAYSPPGPARGVIRAARAEPADREWLGRWWDRQVEMAGTARSTQATAADDRTPEDEPLPFSAISVERLDAPLEELGVDLGIWIPEQAESAIGEHAFATLESRIAAIPGVAKVVWEDREVLYARQEVGRTPGLLRDAIVAMLRADVARLRAADAADAADEDEG